MERKLLLKSSLRLAPTTDRPVGILLIKLSGYKGIHSAEDRKGGKDSSSTSRSSARTHRRLAGISSEI